jgi:hypothetical protein
MIDLTRTITHAQIVTAVLVSPKTDPQITFSLYKVILSKGVWNENFDQQDCQSDYQKQSFPDPQSAQKRQKQARKRRNKTLIHIFEKKKELGFLWHTDAIFIWWYGSRRHLGYWLGHKPRSRNDTWPCGTTIRLSRHSISNSVPAATSWRVTKTSSGLGVGSPEGC